MGRMTSIGEDELQYDEQGRLIKYNDTIIEYDINGKRKSKDDTKYYVSGNRILREKSSLHDITYLYSLDKLVGFVYNGITYFYQRNILVDIVKIYNTSSVLVAEYKYDAWGKHEVVNHTTLNIGDINPFRYRGYYYDKEIGLYYLNSRYYSSELCRFISPDSIEYLDPQSINGLNLYAYCINNPVMMIDPSGHASEWLKIFTDILVTVLAVAAAIAVTALLSFSGFGVFAFVGGLATFGAINNSANIIYYNYISDGKSNLNSSSYTHGYVSRWDRLDYTKKMTKEDKYNFNSWRYFSEYNAHIYGWYLLKGYYTGNLGGSYLSDLAYRAYSADVSIDQKDPNYFIRLLSRIIGMLGI